MRLFILKEYLTKRRNLIFLLIGLAILLLGIGIYKLAWMQSGIPNSLVQASTSVSFPLYYPTKLPNGYQFSPHSVSQPQSGVVIFYFTKLNYPNIYLSEEPRPTNFNFNSFTNSLRSSKILSSPLGHVIIGKASHATLVSLLTTKSWIIANINSNKNTDYAELSLIIQSLSSIR